MKGADTGNQLDVTVPIPEPNVSGLSICDILWVWTNYN
jgi:hypothetical protein